MAVTLRNRRTSYDNIAVGSATGAERPITGDVQPAQTWGQGANIAVGSDYGKENVIVSGTALIIGENL